MKSERSGDKCVVAPVTRKKGLSVKERAFARGDTSTKVPEQRLAEASTRECNDQSTDTTREVGKTTSDARGRGADAVQTACSKESPKVIGNLSASRPKSLPWAGGGVGVARW